MVNEESWNKTYLFDIRRSELSPLRINLSKAAPYTKIITSNGKLKNA
ncbi:MAG: hypothetical protein ACKO96_38470 [Flammeovirgaceae bacterium]